MKKFAHCVGLVGLFALVSFAGAKDPDPAVKKMFEKMVGAIESNDRAAFVAQATDAVKEGVTKEVMDALNKQLGPRLKKGYEATYLCELKQQAHQTHLWKVSFKDKADDIVVRIALKDGKVDGFFLQ
jgi:hypothetical protein